MRTDTGDRKLLDGLSQMREAMQLYDNGSAQAEEFARSALVTLRSAVDWLEDTPAMERGHRHLDEAGAWVRETFGCQVPWSDEHKTFVQQCPVALAHNRLGFSPELTNIVSICTICGQNPFMCSHVTGRMYEAPRLLADGHCNVCHKNDCVEHETGRLYEIECIHLVTSFSAEGVAIVNRPANPDARILLITLSMAELSAELGVNVTPMTPISCDRCLKPCSGFVDHNRE